MINQVKNVFTFSLFLILTSCMDRIDNRYLKIYNNSNKAIYNIISPNDSMNVFQYNDDFVFKGNYIYSKEGNIKMFVFFGIKPYTKMDSNDRPKNWDLYFESIEDKKMRLFIVNKDSVDKYGWKTIFRKSIYNKKYYLTLENLDNMKWEFEYKGE